jgi:hypothetical protein
METQDARSELVMARLAGLREQRHTQLVNAEELADRIRSAVADAQAVGIPMAEVARTLDIDRSTLYRVYASA